MITGLAVLDLGVLELKKKQAFLPLFFYKKPYLELLFFDFLLLFFLLGLESDFTAFFFLAEVFCTSSLFIDERLLLILAALFLCIRFFLTDLSIDEKALEMLS